MKQTAVDWLYEKFLFAGYATPSEWKKQAKEIEKEQIMQTLNDGKEMAIFPNLNKSLEQYYKETYGDDT